MAQQYPSTPSYGTQYAQSQYYPGYNANGPTTASSAMPQFSSQHMGAPPVTPTHNTQRYGANAQIPVAPLPHQMSQPFSPDFYKQYAGSHLPHPPPPPPPPPPLNYAHPSMPHMNPAALGQAAPVLSAPMPPQPNYAYGTEPSQGAFRNIPQPYTSPAHVPQVHPQTEGQIRSLQHENVSGPVQFPSTPSQSQQAPAHTLDGAALSTASQDAPRNATQAQDYSRQQEHRPPSQAHGQRPMSSAANRPRAIVDGKDVRDQAKIALASLAASGITFQDLLKEGIDSHVLTALFDELGLNKKPATSPIAAQTSGSKTQITGKTPSNSYARDSPVADVQDPPLLKQAMERKDRIAQLLAAKTGNANLGTKSPHSASPVSTPGSQAALPANKATGTSSEQAAPQNIQPRSRVNDHSAAPVEPVDTNALRSGDVEHPPSSLALPTPIRTQLEESGMSGLIPGLFMTSADLGGDESIIREALSIHRQAASDHSTRNEAAAQHLIDSLAADRRLSPNSLKRFAETWENDEVPPAKRSAYLAEETADVEMEVSKTDEESEEMEEGEYDPEVPEPPPPTEAVQPGVTSRSGPSPVEASANRSEMESRIQELRRRILEKEQHALHRQPPDLAHPSATPSLATAAAKPSAADGVQAGDGGPGATTEKHVSTFGTSRGPRIDPGKLAARMAALKADLVAKNSRKKALQEGMPALNAEVQAIRTKLGQMRRDLLTAQTSVLERAAELEQARKMEQALAQSVEGLEQQLENSISGQKHFSNELSELNDQIRDDEAASHASQAQQTLNTQPSGLHNAKSRSRTSSRSVEDEAKRVEAHTEQSPRQVEPVQKDPLAYRTHVDPVRRVENLEPSFDGSATQGSSEGSDAGSDNEQMSIDEDENEDESDGSASMSDSGSEDDEPGEEDKESANNQTDDAGSDHYEPRDTSMNDADGADRPVDADDYEPSEEVDVLDPADLESLRRDHDSSAAFSAPQEESLTNGTGNVTPAVVEDVATIYQPTGETAPTQTSALYGVASLSGEPLGNGRHTSESRFIPYRSPLTPLKSFRFHPQFNELIKHGYRSLTYSNQIDPKRPLCPTELDGHPCTDPTCEEQHFGTMALSDDKILVQMSSANDLKDKAQRDAYLVGLKKVIADLKDRGVKEFSEVAEALSKYRREWMQAQMAATL